MTPPHGESYDPKNQGQYGGQPYGQPYGQYPQQPGYGPAPAYGASGYGGYGMAPGPPPENHLVWAILSTVLCCLPLGIVSIIKSTQVNSLWAQGQYDQARKSADDAKKWAMWSAIVSVVATVIIVIVYVVFFALLAANVETG
ncbi:MAG TPA: CD225/dispanin family protein [Pseudonocardiaceae bacterium]